MRFLTTYTDERKAFSCINFLHKEGVEARYEATKETFSIWVIEEDDFEKAGDALAKFEALPIQELQAIQKSKQVIPQPINLSRKEPAPINLRWQKLVAPPKRNYWVTYGFILICAALFFLNMTQEPQLIKQEGEIALQIGLTPLQKDLVFDYPGCFTQIQALLQQHPLKNFKEIATLPEEVQAEFAKAENCPFWKGLFEITYKKITTGKGSYTNAPLFEKIRNGEIWRLFTPTLLHRDFLHILFNMAWLLILGRMMEERVGKVRLFSLILIMGIVSNVAQYLMSGPFFLGFSGVVVGMVGFIWMRQRMSPWEGYPLTGGTTFFILIFVIAMLLLQWVSLGMEYFGVEGFASNIANTAHIVGGLTGLLLARIPFFSRGPS